MREWRSEKEAVRKKRERIKRIVKAMHMIMIQLCF